VNILASSPLFSTLVLLASSSALSAAITAWFRRGDVDATMTKKKADAAKVLSDLAISETQRMSEQMDEFRMALRAHREWDRKMVTRARQAGIEIDDPPELYL
jgi:uncharacterized membrane protein